MSPRRSGRRVVVTGIGAVSPFGWSTAELWPALVQGRSGTGTIRAFDAQGLPIQFAAEVPESPMQRAVLPTGLSRLSRKDAFGWFAAQEAVRDAGVDLHRIASRMGVALGAERRCLRILERMSTKVASQETKGDAFDSTYALGNAIGINFGCSGPQLSISAACASSTQAVGMAFQQIRRGRADVMIAGGFDSVVDRLMIAALHHLELLSLRNHEPERASRPFDRGRDGFVLGEGAGMLLLEEFELARRRGARIYGEVLGYAASSNGDHLLLPPPEGSGLCFAIKAALNDANVSNADVDYINAHGTSTVHGDRSEAAAIRAAFGPRAGQVPISATKSMLGHAMCASGAIEAIACLLTVSTGIVTPTINFELSDEGCDLDFVPNVARQYPVRIAMSNSFGFGGTNAALVFGSV